MARSRRHAVVAGVLLSACRIVPELFDVLTSIAPRMEAGAISPAWGAVDGYVDFFRRHARDGRKPRTVEDAAFGDTRAWRDERQLGR